MQTFNNSRPQNSSTVQFCYNTRTCKRTKCRLTYCTYRGEYAPVFPEWYLQYQPDWQNSTEKQRKTLHVHQRKKKSVWLSRAVRLTHLFRGKGKSVMTFDCCIKKQKIWNEMPPTLWNLSKNALKRKMREKKYFLTSGLRKTVTMISKKSFKLSTRGCHNFIVLVYQ